MNIIVDTNVPIVANGDQSEQASLECQLACVQRLTEIMRNDTVVIDALYLVIGEYENKLDAKKEPGIGHAFLKWIYRHLGMPDRCVQLSITPVGNSFAEFPNDPVLAGFDPSDRKFVAVTLAHPDRPPILNAVDTDWAIYEHDLAKHGIVVEFICPDDIQKIMIDK